MDLTDSQYNQARNEFERQNQSLDLTKNGNYVYTNPTTASAFTAFLAAFETSLITDPPSPPVVKRYVSSDDIAR